MESGLLSRREVIEASKEFVRVRLNTHEDKDDAVLMLKLGGVRAQMTKGRLNVNFFLLDPTGEKVLFTQGDRYQPDFMKEEGGVSGIVAKMEKVAKQYPGKASQAELVPWNKSLSGALVRAHADAEPLLLLIADGRGPSMVLEKAVSEVELLRRFRTDFFFVKLGLSSEEITTYKLPQAPGLLFLRPSRLGTEAVVMNTKADPDDLAKSMADALAEFGKTFPKLSRKETLEKGKSEKIHHPGAGRSPGPGGVGLAQKADPEKRPGVSGDWVGTWGSYSPPKDGEPPPSTKYTKEQLRLDCKVVELRDGKWQATFEGECGRPYKYTIQMTGRQVGDIVLFQGSADLGEKDGGVYDWIGRATEGEFVGFYTSKKYTGQFRLARPKKSEPAKKPDDKPAKPKIRPANPSGPTVPQQGNLKPGDAAPDFTLKLLDDKDGKTVTLSNLKGKKPVVLIFGSFT